MKQIGTDTRHDRDDDDRKKLHSEFVFRMFFLISKNLSSFAAPNLQDGEMHAIFNNIHSKVNHSPRSP